ncbi:MULTISPECIES: FTR1 family iron permease [Paenibacillus]|uniref:FTR1 family iron permease n=1 Tax=Paenibacillus TaxID=44249 RepID=UPI000A6DEB0F|nr:MULTISPECIES: FTR1 family protein [Paenibacillus]
MNLEAAASMRIVRLMLLGMLAAMLMSGRTAWASGAGDSHAKENVPAISGQADIIYASLEAKDSQAAAETFKAVKKWWALHKADVKGESLDLALEIDKQIADLSLSLLTEDLSAALDTSGALRFSLHNYEDGAYAGNDGKTKMTLAFYVSKLADARNKADRQDWAGAASLVKQLQSQWLAVEGDVVSRSQKVYNDTERDLVLADAYLANEGQRPQASAVLKRMADSLAPLAEAGYSWWDAALIPLREGLEAVLVVGALLVAAGRSKSAAAKRWVAGGSALGMLVCLAAGFAIAILFSSEAFGGSSSLINGWTGILSSLLLLYVSYWLHRNADIGRWNKFLNRQSDKAASSGRMVSFGLLAFFAILREGLETVIFLIGLAGKMSLGTLAAGIGAGFGLLFVLAFIILKAGQKLPVRPLFLASSLVVFYLCFKFLGSGIHSLQMAGAIPSDVKDYLPQWASISLYPSWYSTLPQLVFVLLALAGSASGWLKRLGGHTGRTETAS